MLAILSLAISLSWPGGLGHTQTTPLDWRRTDMSADTFGATAFTPEVDGVHRVIVVVRAPVDRSSASGAYRSLVMEAEVRCGERLWQIMAMTYYAADYSIVRSVGPIPEAPLIRETPLHAAVTDVCDGGHTGAIGITTDDPIAVQRWLGGL